jgi:N-acetylglucosamine-6-phosphate deacetylase
MTPDRHAVTGFHLEGPHAEVQCAQCHSPELAFDERNA